MRDAANTTSPEDAAPPEGVTDLGRGYLSLVAVLYTLSDNTLAGFFRYFDFLLRKRYLKKVPSMARMRILMCEEFETDCNMI